MSPLPTSIHRAPVKEHSLWKLERLTVGCGTHLPEPRNQRRTGMRDGEKVSKVTDAPATSGVPVLPHPVLWVTGQPVTEGGAEKAGLLPGKGCEHHAGDV